MSKTYTPEEQARNRQGAYKALRENKKKSKNGMRDEVGGRCCLCVMMDYAKSVEPDVDFGLNNSYPARKLEDFYGIPSGVSHNACSYSRLLWQPKVNGFELSDLNDGWSYGKVREHTHAEIADMLEEEYDNTKKN